MLIEGVWKNSKSLEVQIFCVGARRPLPSVAARKIQVYRGGLDFLRSLKVQVFFCARAMSCVLMPMAAAVTADPFRFFMCRGGCLKIFQPDSKCISSGHGRSDPCLFLQSHGQRLPTAANFF